MTELYRIFLNSNGISTDTRTIKEGEVFFALKGENFNGNTHATKALEYGAIHVVIDEDIELKDKTKISKVNNVLSSLQQMAQEHRRHLNIPIIGITGTNGKTTTKELIVSVLQEKFNTGYTLGNLNNHIGVPLTLLSFTQNTQIGVVEMGANKPGDIKELAEIAEPNIGIITNIGSAHLLGFNSVENIIQTKKELFDYIEKTSGEIVINQDDKTLNRIAPAGINKIYYGESSSYINGKVIQSGYHLEIESNIGNIKTKLIGDYNLTNVLVAVTIGKFYGLNYSSIIGALEKYTPSNNRSQLIEAGDNIIIADAYNANPTSVDKALKSLINLKSPKPLAILGDMLELGNFSNEKHREVIHFLDSINLEYITIGKYYKKFSKRNYETVEDFILKHNKLSGYTILIKGSRGIKLEKLIEHIT
jgi:UDP-N-acetylmuramoyl-tripeptide--D-alanyl-D-alanine ligase